MRNSRIKIAIALHQSEIQGMSDVLNRVDGQIEQYSKKMGNASAQDK